MRQFALMIGLILVGCGGTEQAATDEVTEEAAAKVSTTETEEVTPSTTEEKGDATAEKAGHNCPHASADGSCDCMKNH